MRTQMERQGKSAKCLFSSRALTSLDLGNSEDAGSVTRHQSASKLWSTTEAKGPSYFVKFEDGRIYTEISKNSIPANS